MIRNCKCLALVFSLLPAAALAQEPRLPPGDKEPFFRLEVRGPTSYVTDLAFSPDARLLYTAGWDKVVRVWKLDGKGRFVLDEQTAYRVPIGPGVDGSINAIALSPDGAWLAVGGNGLVRGTAGFRTSGKVFDRRVMNPTMRQDQGTIYCFDTRMVAGGAPVRILRGHLGPIVSLSFAQQAAGRPPALVSAAQEWDEEQSRWIGAVRLWDVQQEKALGQLRPRRDPLPDLTKLKTRPGLACWADNGGLFKVAVAWGDGPLRLWDVDAKTFQEVDDGRRNNTAALHSGMLITGSFRNPNGRLTLWDVQGGQPAGLGGISFPPTSAPNYFAPCALALFPSRPDQAPDHAAVVLREDGPNPVNHLRIVRLDREGWTTVRDVPLWRGAKEPALAAGSGHVAVAGNAQHEIRVFAVGDLLNGNGGRIEPQRLQGVGTTFHQVAFATNGEHLGLILSTRRKTAPGKVGDLPQAGDRAFDLSQGKLGDRGGWQIVAPELRGWKVETAQNANGSIGKLWVIDPADTALPAMPVKEGQEVTDYALLPYWLPPQVPILALHPASHFLLPLFGQSRAPYQIPILAVATHEDGEPYLTLYNAASGEAVRRLAGHVERVHALAFAPGGRVLASVSEDQTVSVWSLADLDQILGRRGGLPGLNVKKAAGGTGVAVDEIDPAQFHGAGLAVGDVVEGRLVGERLQPFDSALDFEESIRRAGPGTVAEFQVRGKPNAQMRIGQGVDVRNPLFSLFITRGKGEWIGWSPMGPYDTSGRAAENYLGWHFNTGDPAAPTRFALANQYRDAFYRSGLLPELLETKRPPSPRRPEPRPQPKMVLWLEQPGSEGVRADDRGPVLIREPQGSLHFAIRNYPREKIAAARAEDQAQAWVQDFAVRSYPQEKIGTGAQGVQWQIDSGPPQPFDSFSEAEWTADLNGLMDWKRGIHTLRVTLRTQEEQTREFTSELTFRYQPKAPVIQSTAKNLTVNQAALFWEITVEPGAPKERLKVKLVQRSPGRGIIKEQSYERSGKIQEALQLEPGENEIEVEAANRDALAGFEEFETTRRSWLVTYLKPREEPPPQISLRVVPVGGQAADGPLEAAGDRPAVVHVPKVGIEAAIQAAPGAGPLVSAEWARGKAQPAALEGFASGKEREWKLTREEELTPGTGNVFHLRSKTANSPVREVALKVDYRPRLPDVALIQPADGISFAEGKDAREVPFEARLVWPADRQPCRAFLVVNGKEVGEPHPVAAGTASWTGKAPLAFGSNSIQVRLTNEWGMSASSETSQIRYLRPPRITELTGPASTRQALVDLEAKVISSTRPERPVVLVHGERKEVEVGRVVQLEGKPDTWTVALKKVPLEVGENPVSLSVSNSDGQCLQPGAYSVRYGPPPAPPAPPEVEIVAPTTGSRTTEDQALVSIRIKSAKPISHVDVVREADGAARLVKPVPANQWKAAGDGIYEVTKLGVPLAPGLNQLRISAANEGGQRTSDPVQISYSRVPIRVVIDAIEPWEPSGQAIRPAAGELDRPLTLKVAGGRVWLHGRVIGREKNDEELRRVKGLWVYVNDIRQLPADLRPLTRNTSERQFRVPLLLNDKDNHITIETVNVIKDASNRAEFKLECAQPEKNQRLHLIIVGSDTTDVKQLRERALMAVGAPPAATERFRTPAFQAGYLDGPLTTFVTTHRLYSMLVRVQKRIKELSREGPPMSDVIMFFYQGRESADSREGFRWSEESWNEMHNLFAATPGAQVLFLDVTRDEAPPPDEPWDEDRRIGVMHYAWLRPQAAPPDARLMTTLENTMPRSSRLGDLEVQVGDKLDQIGKRYPEFFRYEAHLPDDLKTLVINNQK
jgi:WD40 repeat protein